MNALQRLIGSSIGGQVAATLLAGGSVDGIPRDAGFVHAFLIMAGVSLLAAAIAITIPSPNRLSRLSAAGDLGPSTT